MALSKDRNTKRRDGVLYSDPAAAGAVIYAGALVVIDAAGNAAPGSTATGLRARGLAQEQVNNSAGIAGAQTVNDAGEGVPVFELVPAEPFGKQGLDTGYP